VTVTTPPRGPEIEQDRDLEQRVADLEALIEEARRRARRRRMRNAAAVAVAAAVGVAGLIGFGGWSGGGAGTAALADGSGAGGQAKTPAPSLAALPAGDQPSVFAFDRPNVVYVASAHARDGVYVHKSTDGGRHWHPTAARGTGWISDILSLTVDPRSPGTLYAGTDVAVYKTVNGGRSWRPFNQGLFPPHGGQRVCYRPVGARPYCVKLPFGTPGTTSWNRNNGWVGGVAVDPADSSVVYSATDTVRKSTDGGHTWKTVLLPYPTQQHGVTRIAIAPTRPESIYAIAHTSTGRTAIYKSTDAGRTWHATGSGASVFPNSNDWDSSDALAIDAQHPRTVYAAVGRTLLKTTDAGASWQPITNGLPAGVTSLAAHPQRSGTLYAGLHTGDGTGAIYETTDGGRTWNAAESGPAITTLAVDPARPTTIWAAGWTRRKGTRQYKSFLIRSTDRGRTWTTAG
jgi:photosystem II stability/assembly factor-like uncharacterized protein